MNSVAVETDEKFIETRVYIMINDVRVRPLSTHVSHSLHQRLNNMVSPFDEMQLDRGEQITDSVAQKMFI